MWRSLFIAVGIFAIVLGLECLVVEEFEWRPKARPGAPATAAAPRGEQFAPPDWAPWGLLSTGAITVVYAVALPKRLGMGG